jgi:hypothetical protein
VSAVLLPVGGLFMVTAVLPQDRRTVRFVAFVGVSYFSFAAAHRVRVLHRRVANERCDVSGWACNGTLVYLGLAFLIDAITAGSFAYTLCFAPAHKALARLWRILGYSSYSYACNHSIQLACGVLYLRWVASLRMVAYVVFGSVYLYPRARERVQAALRRQGHAIDVAMIIAECLQGDADPDDLRRKSGRAFRYVYLKDMTLDDMVAATSGTRSQELFLRTHPARLGEVDAFISHSWHDDPRAKWDSLQAWCDDFAANYGRPPKLWLDCCCIDQNNIEASLRCLPVFLSGCTKLLVIAGGSYARRLWCAIELFVYVCIHQKASSDCLEVRFVGKTAEERSLVGESFKSFDVLRCECSKSEDQQRLQGLVEAGCGTSENLNVQIRSMLGGLQEAQSEV